jgi:hypothetical protein
MTGIPPLRHSVRSDSIQGRVGEGRFTGRLQVLQTPDWHRAVTYALVDNDRRASLRSRVVRPVTNVLGEPQGLDPTQELSVSGRKYQLCAQ